MLVDIFDGDLSGEHCQAVQCLDVCKNHMDLCEAIARNARSESSSSMLNSEPAAFVLHPSGIPLVATKWPPWLRGCACHSDSLCEAF